MIVGEKRKEMAIACRVAQKASNKDWRKFIKRKG